MLRPHQIKLLRKDSDLERVIKRVNEIIDSLKGVGRKVDNFQSELSQLRNEVNNLRQR